MSFPPLPYMYKGVFQCEWKQSFTSIQIRDVKQASQPGFGLALTGRGLKKTGFFRAGNITTLTLSGFGLNEPKRAKNQTSQITNLRVKF